MFHKRVILSSFFALANFYLECKSATVSSISSDFGAHSFVIPEGSVLCPGKDPKEYCDCDASSDCGSPFCECEEGLECCKNGESSEEEDEDTSENPFIIPEYAVLCPGKDPKEYCDCHIHSDCGTDFCECGAALKCCEDGGISVEPFEIPEYAVLCPAKHPEEYCDCDPTSDCGSDFCGCDAGIKCCENAESSGSTSYD